MERPSNRIARSFTGLLLSLAASALVFTAVPQAAQAQNIVVTKFADRSKKKLGQKAWAAIARELKKRGARIVSNKQYMRAAKKSRIRPRNVLKAMAVKRLAKKLKLKAVVGGSAIRKKNRFVVTINVIGANGKVVLKKAYRLRKPIFPKKTAADLADAIMEKIGGKTHVAAADPKPGPDPVEPTKPPPGDDKPAGGGDDTFLPAWARTDKKDPPDSKPAPEARADPEPVAAEAEVEDKPTRRSERKQGSVNDLLIAAGASFHHRAGLDPRHEASLFPGVRVDARMFMGTFLDIPVVRDIGIGGMFDMSLGLEYGYADADNAWSATQMQWRGELIYRLALDTGLRPTFLFRAGYGATTSSIDSAVGDLALSSSYMAPYVALDIYLTLWEPMLRLFASGGFLFLVAAGDDISGSGMGFNVFAGLDVDIMDMIHVGVGYDLTQYLMDDDSTGGVGKYSDTYQGFFVRVGYNYN